MSVALVGYTGFVGLNLMQFYKFDYFYNSSNFHEAKYKEFDTIFFAGIPAVKWYANQNPEEDTQTIVNIKNILETIKTNKIILISTIDVYEYIDLKHDEIYDCDIFNNHTYGRNRYLFENFIQKQFINHYIVRLPALFGKGLKKNILYDLINNNQIKNIEMNTTFQWYNLDWLKHDIDIVISNNIRVCNLFTEPLATIELLRLFKHPLNIYKTQSKMIYNLQTKYSHMFNSNIDGYIRDKNAVLSSIQEYLNFTKVDKTKLVVSNICVKHISQFQFACILKLFGIQHVQIAPTTLIEGWSNLDNLNLETYTKNNLNIYSFQSITYGLNANIFDLTSNILFNHVTKVIDCGIKHNVKVLVFGCPKNRQIINLKDINGNNKIFIDFFRKIGDYIGDNELTICIENNSKQYACNYLNKISEVGNIVREIGHKNIKMMVDIGNAIMENDNLNDICKYKDILYNVDIAREYMKSFIEYTRQYNDFIYMLNDVNYLNNINLEMIINENECAEELNVLCNSLHKFIKLNGVY